MVIALGRRVGKVRDLASIVNAVHGIGERESPLLGEEVFVRLVNIVVFNARVVEHVNSLEQVGGAEEKLRCQRSVDNHHKRKYPC